MKKRILLRLAVAIPATFFIWLLLAETLFSSALQVFIQFWMNTVHPELFATIEANSHHQWAIKTNLFVASSPWPDGAYMPTLSISKTTTINVADYTLYTLGFPLIWILQASVWRFKLSGTVLAHVATGLGVVLFSGLYTTLTLIRTTSVPVLLRVYYDGYIYIPKTWPSWSIEVLKPIVEAGILATILFLPLLFITHHWNNTVKK